LHQAVLSNHLNVVHYFISEGVNLSHKDEDGRTALALAYYQQQQGKIASTIVAALEAAKAAEFARTPVSPYAASLASGRSVSSIRTSDSVRSTPRSAKPSPRHLLGQQVAVNPITSNAYTAVPSAPALTTSLEPTRATATATAAGVAAIAAVGTSASVSRPLPQVPVIHFPSRTTSRGSTLSEGAGAATAAWTNGGGCGGDNGTVFADVASTYSNEEEEEDDDDDDDVSSLLASDCEYNDERNGAHGSRSHSHRSEVKEEEEEAPTATAVLSSPSPSAAAAAGAGGTGTGGGIEAELRSPFELDLTPASTKAPSRTPPTSTLVPTSSGPPLSVSPRLSAAMSSSPHSHAQESHDVTAGLVVPAGLHSVNVNSPQPQDEFLISPKIPKIPLSSPSSTGSRSHHRSKSLPSPNVSRALFGKQHLKQQQLMHTADGTGAPPNDASGNMHAGAGAGTGAGTGTPVGAAMNDPDNKVNSSSNSSSSSSNSSSSSAAFLLLQADTPRSEASSSTLGEYNSDGDVMDVLRARERSASIAVTAAGPSGGTAVGGKLSSGVASLHHSGGGSGLTTRSPTAAAAGPTRVPAAGGSGTGTAGFNHMNMNSSMSTVRRKPLARRIRKAAGRAMTFIGLPPRAPSTATSTSTSGSTNASTNTGTGLVGAASTTTATTATTTASATAAVGDTHNPNNSNSTAMTTTTSADKQV